jgi:hypothetical protein
MRRRPFLLLPALLAACTSPPVSYYTLQPRSGRTLPAVPGRMELRRIGLAAYLDRPGLVRDGADYKIEVSETERWAEPLGRMIGRLLTEELLDRLPDLTISAETGAITTDPDLVVEIDISRFEADATGAVVLLAQVSLRQERGNHPAIARTLHLTRPAGTGTEAQIAAMSDALGDLADHIAAMVAAAR